MRENNGSKNKIINYGRYILSFLEMYTRAYHADCVHTHVQLFR